MLGGYNRGVYRLDLKSGCLTVNLKYKLGTTTERKAQLRTVLALRTFAVSILLLVLGFAHVMNVVRLPWSTLLFVLALMLFLNVLAWLRLRAGPVGPYEVGAQIFSDLFGFSVLLYFTGGATNPFVMFYLPLLGLAAALLPWGQVLALAGFSIFAYSVLMLEYIPLVLTKPQNAIELHLLGMWINFLVSVAILVGFVARLSDRIRLRDQDLNAAQAVLNREARMAALGNQAASLAHELGTPLSIAKIILSDWMENSGGNPPSAFLQESVVLSDQLQRMEACLVRLRSSLESPAQSDGQSRSGDLSVKVRAKAWLESWLDDWSNRNPQLVVTCHAEVADSLEGSAPWDSLELVLNGLLNNSMQAYARLAACPSTQSTGFEQPVAIKLSHVDGMLCIEVEDRAGGFDKEVISRLGREPIWQEAAGTHRGMGLYLSLGLMERAGGFLQFLQVLEHGQLVGARVLLTVPLVQSVEKVQV